MIVVEHVTKEYKNRKHSFRALDDVSVEINDNEFVSILGPSGSGKSTLMHLIGGLDKPSSGAVIIDSLDLSSLMDHQLALFRNKNVGFVFQFFNLISGTSVYDNVALPLVYAQERVRSERSQVTDILAAVGLQEKILSKPNELSGGEQQRVSIARALVNDPKIVLADEPTGNLDSTNGASILAILKGLQKKGKTIVMVTHDIDIALKTDRVIRIRDGKLI